jgi:exosortase
MNAQMLTRQGWTIWHAIGAIVAGGLCLALTWTAWADIYRTAKVDEEQSHIFLVPIVMAWMVWARRVRFRQCPPAGMIFGPIILAVSWAVYLFGFNNGYISLWHAGAVGMVLGSVLTFLGKNLLMRFLPAFAVLIFLVPIPGTIRTAISLPLQTAGAYCTQVILETVGIEVDRAGNSLFVNGIGVTVAEACNGMRMVFALVLVSYAFAFGMPLRNSARFGVLLISPIAALVCNILRLIPTVLLYGYSTEPVAKQFHDVSGWLMVPLAFLLLLAGLKVLRWALIPVTRYNLAYQ